MDSNNNKQFTCIRPNLQKLADNISNLLPKNSATVYEKRYEFFFAQKQPCKIYGEHLIAYEYFAEKANSVKSLTLWAA